jgi:hypothetical protein
MSTILTNRKLNFVLKKEREKKKQNFLAEEDDRLISCTTQQQFVSGYNKQRDSWEQQAYLVDLDDPPAALKCYS